MADLRRQGERAQLLLVTAIGIAVLLVVLALLLNSLIFTESFAHRTGPAKNAQEAVDYHGEAERAVTRLLFASNHETGTFATLDARFSDRVRTWRDLSARQLGTKGAVVHVNPHQTEGGRITQDNGSRAFTNASGSAASWTLVDGTNGARAWHLDVSRASLVSTNAIADETDPTALVDARVFHVAVANATHTWRIFVYQDGASDALVRVESPDGTLSDACRATGTADGTVLVGVTNATVGGGECAPLANVDLGGEPFTVAYRAGDNAAGTYSLVVTPTAGTVDDADLSTPGSGRPYATGAIYATSVEIGYATPSFRYDATVLLEPGELT